MNRKFLIASLLAAGFTAHEPLAAQFVNTVSRRDETDQKPSLFKTLKQDRGIVLAQHRSHSSHSSHRSSSGGGHYSHSSHTSHRSSAAGYDSDYAPAPLYSPPAPAPAPAPSTFRPNTLYNSSAASGTTVPSDTDRAALFKSTVKRVQIALMARGFYDGIIDGDVGPGTRRALRLFQSKVGLDQTGTITPATLRSLNVVSGN